jgi:FkbH-like protein
VTDVAKAIAGLTPEQLQLLQRRLDRKKGTEAPKPAIPRRGRDTDRFPLSPAQQRFWFLDQLQPGSGAFNIPLAARLRGDLDAGVLARSLTAMTARHEVLRTTFTAEDGRPLQVIGKAAAAPLPVVDLRGLEPALREAEVERLAVAEARRPFDLARGPLVRLTLLRLDAAEHVALLTFHHIVADRWSVGIFFGELMALYGGAPLSPLPIQYADFACWQRERLEEGGLLDRQLDYWKKQLAGAPAALALPTDRPRLKGGSPSARRGHLPLNAGRELAESLRAVGRSAEASLSMVLLAAFAALLGRWSRQEDVVVGSPIANRGRFGVGDLIGCFANDLVLRTDLSGDPAFRELLARVRGMVLGAYDHADVPLEKLIEVLRPDREPGRNPLAQVFFVLENVPMPSAGPAGLEVSLLDVERPAGQFDLLAFLSETPEGVSGSLFYDAELFAPGTMEGFAASFAAILERVAAEPEVRLSALPLAGGLEPRAEETLVAVTSTFTADLMGDSLEAWLEELEVPARIEFAPYNQVFQQLLDPSSLLGRNVRGVDVVLLRFEDWERYGGGDAERNTGDLAAALRASAARSPAFHLAVACPPSPAWKDRHEALEAELEAALAGSGVAFVRAAEILDLFPVAAPHDPHADELGHVPYTPAFFAALGTLVARKIQARRAAPIKAVAVDCDNTLWAGVCGEDGPSGVVIDEPRRAFQEELVRLHDAGVLICLLSKNAEADVDAVFAAHPDMPLAAEHVVARRIDWAPKSANLRALAAELGLGIDAFAVIDDNPVECAEIRAGCPGALVLQLPERAAEIPGFLRHVWALDRLEATAEDRKRTDLYRRNAERERFRGRAASFQEFLDGLDLRVEISPLAPGHLTRAAQLTARTNQLNASTVRRTEGELRDFLAAGGEGRVVEVSDRFGDYGLVGLMLFSGSLVVDTLLLSCRVLGKGVEHRMLAELGRLAGERGLAEVVVPFRRTDRNRPALDFLAGVGRREGDAYRFPAAEAAAVAFTPAEAPAPPAPEASEEGAAPVRSSRRAAPERSDPEEILAWVRSRKQAPREEAAEYVAPRTPIEELLAEIWMELLGADRVGVHDSFFRLGGHSLLGTVLLSRVRDAFEVEVPLFTLFEAPTLEGLAGKIEDALIRDAGADEIADGLAELDGLTDEEVRALLDLERAR